MLQNVSITHFLSLYNGIVTQCGNTHTIAYTLISVLADTHHGYHLNPSQEVVKSSGHRRPETILRHPARACANQPVICASTVCCHGDGKPF